MPAFYIIFVPKMPEFYLIIARKNIFQIFFGGGGEGARAPAFPFPSPPSPVSYT